MAENSVRLDDAVTELTCGICLEDSKNPLNLPCGHSFCEGCLDEWRSRYGVKEEMRRKCPICRASIPPSRDMVAALQCARAQKQRKEEDNDTSSEEYHFICRGLARIEEMVGADWDGVTVLEDNNDTLLVAMPDYIIKAVSKGDIKAVLKWINANRTEDRVNAITGAKVMRSSVLMLASLRKHLALMMLLLQLGAEVDHRNSQGCTAIGFKFDSDLASVESSEIVRLLLSWGATFIPGSEASIEYCISAARRHGKHELANLIESELGGRRCEIVNLSSRPELNSKTCVADEYLPDSNQYRVTLETKSKEALILDSENLKRRDRTPQDCGYYVEFKNGRTIRHDFDSSEDCQAFVAALNDDGEAQPVVTEEAEARAEQAAAELLAELGLDNTPNDVPTSDDQHVKKSKKKKGGKKKKKK